MDSNIFIMAAQGRGRWREVHGKARGRHGDRERGRGEKRIRSETEEAFGRSHSAQALPQEDADKGKVLVLPVLGYRFFSAPWGGSRDFSVYCRKTW